MFDGKRILITGGTGSLGKALVRRIVSQKHGLPRKVTVLSRDEAKQYDMRLEFQELQAATEELIYRDAQKLLHFRIGDVRDYSAVAAAVHDADIVFHAAALKQVPSCEYFPAEAVATNVTGVENIARAIASHRLPVEAVIGISTDKACKPVNVMGMTKALQERVLVSANLNSPQTRFLAVRYGNVLASRGSVVPLFHSQIRDGGPVTITTFEMTRFLLSMRQAVDTVLDAYRFGNPGDVIVPRIPSCRVVTLARCLIDGRGVDVVEVGIRPGEKVHEVLVSEDEVHRTEKSNGYYFIRPLLPELGGGAVKEPGLDGEFSSRDHVMSPEATRALLVENRLTLEDAPVFQKLY
jgi:UDP-glucose 4-epimerase